MVACGAKQRLKDVCYSAAGLGASLLILGLKYSVPKKVWEVDPVLLPFRDIPPFGRLPGYAGPPNRKAAEVVTKYIITDMYAKAIQGMPAEAAVKWAHDEVVKAYA